MRLLALLVVVLQFVDNGLVVFPEPAQQDVLFTMAYVSRRIGEIEFLGSCFRSL